MSILPNENEIKYLQFCEDSSCQTCGSSCIKLVNFTAKKILDWGNEECPHEGCFPMYLRKRHCKECWAEIKQELEDSIEKNHF